MFNVIGIEKGTDNKIIIEPNMTEAQAMKMCENWGWNYDYGSKSYTMDIEEVENNTDEVEIKEEVETMTKEITREQVIESAKIFGITQKELGFRDYESDYYNAIQQRDILLTAICDLVRECEIEPEVAREYVPKEWWDDCGITEKKYQVVEVTLKRTQYKKIYVVMKDEECSCDADDYIDLYYADEYESDDYEEGDWETDDYNVDDSDLSYDAVVNRYNTANDIDEIEFN